MSLAVATDTVGAGERRFQLLALDVRIATDCPILDRKLEYLVQDARQDYPMTDEIRLEALRHADGYRICEAGGEPRIESDSSMALGRLHIRAYERAYEILPSTGLFLHAACGSYKGRRFLLLGDSGAGKTTLITRLLTAGALGEGDELALLEGDRLSALPRRFHIKSFGLGHFPGLPARSIGYPPMTTATARSSMLSPRPIGASPGVSAMPASMPSSFSIPTMAGNRESWTCRVIG